MIEHHVRAHQQYHSEIPILGIRHPVAQPTAVAIGTVRMVAWTGTIIWVRRTRALPLRHRNGTWTKTTIWRQWRRRRKLPPVPSIGTLRLNAIGGIRSLTFTRLERDRLARIGRKDYRENICRDADSNSTIQPTVNTKGRRHLRFWHVRRLRHRSADLHRPFPNPRRRRRLAIGSSPRRRPTANRKRPIAMRTARFPVRSRPLRRNGSRLRRYLRPRPPRIGLLVLIVNKDIISKKTSIITLPLTNLRIGTINTSCLVVLVLRPLAVATIKR